MISMKKNHELFWILEILFLLPIALFWVGFASMYLTGSADLLLSIVGDPYSEIRRAFITLVCPAAAAWFALEYLRENKKMANRHAEIARGIIVVSAATIIFVLLYYFIG